MESMDQPALTADSGTFVQHQIFNSFEFELRFTLMYPYFNTFNPKTYKVGHNK